MRLSNFADFAVVMLAAAARYPHGVRVSTTDLARETGVPLPTAQKLMQRMAAAGLLTSARGGGGGFALARSAESISLADIVEAVEGAIALTPCVDHGRDCPLEGNCLVQPHWPIVNQALRAALESVSLDRLANPIPGCPQL